MPKKPLSAEPTCNSASNAQRDAPVLIELVALGVPAPQGNKTSYPVRRGRLGRIGVAVVEGRTKKARENHAHWRMLVALSAQEWLQAHPAFTPIDDAVYCGALFILPRPTSLPKRHTLPTRRPDLSKLLRSIEDSLTGLIYTDDSRITTEHVRKRFVNAQHPVPGVIIRISPDSL
ncbi:MAG: RusA family crossover junction endodeoxyribonuclease [Microbacteriaceae bacterium]|nr:MAG: RusA family crossover junction endodeoxyribonuclease [Microbacteriaceae bacterium]